MKDDPKSPERLDPAAEKIRRRRSIAIGLALGFMVLVFYIATFVRLGGNVVNGIG
ncbi:MAG: protein CoxF [Proteobacteria bacterium]|nr:protein CoxF [Pseudomonadota bacterium]